MTKVINIRHAPPNWEQDPEYVYIGRAGKGHDGYFGNPFKVQSVRGETLDKYREYLMNRLATEPKFKERVSGLYGKTLVCFCKPFPCHGDVLAEVVDNLVKEQEEEK